MHPHVFLLLLSSGVSGYFCPQKEMPHLLNKTKYALVDEMLCLLQTENEHEGNFFTPLHVTNPDCAHSNTEIFIHELKKFVNRTDKCMRRMEKDMEKLEKNCKILKNPSRNHKSCSKPAKTNFSRFKKSLEDFLKWVNRSPDCKNVGRSELGLYLDGECNCPKSWKSHRGLG